MLREGIEFTLNLFMHVVIGRMKGRAEEEEEEEEEEDFTVC